MRGEDAHLALKTQDAAIDIGFLQPDRHVVGKVAGGEVVRTINDDIIVGGNAHGIGRSEALRITSHFEMRIDVLEPLPSRLQLAAPE